MPHKSTVYAVTAIGVDIGKNTLHMVGLDSCGAIVLRERFCAGALHRGLQTCSPASLVSKQE